MKKLLFILSLILFCGQMTFAQTKHSPAAKQTVKPVVKTPVQKKPVIAKSKSAGSVKPFTKIPAKTVPSVRVKTKFTSKKIVIKEKPAKLPAGVNTNENAPVVLSARETEMIREINLLRKNPVAYIPFVEKYMKLNAGNKDIQSAGRELVGELKSMSALPELTPNPVMYSATRQFAQELKKDDEISHSDLPYFENLTFGHIDIREAIIDMLIDDDEPDRGHRRNLLNSSISKVAVYEIPGELQGYKYCFVQEFK